MVEKGRLPMVNVAHDGDDWRTLVCIEIDWHGVFIELLNRDLGLCL